MIYMFHYWYNFTNNNVEWVGGGRCESNKTDFEKKMGKN